MSRRFLLLPLLLLSGQALGAATVYPVAPFSPEYHATVTANGKPGDVYRPGVVRVYKNGIAKPIIEVKADEMAFELKGGKIGANVKELPYGEQSVLMYNDFNFDGRKDFAIMDGQHSCYHGPSFQIFLSVPGGFKYNQDLSDLAHEYCGMFDVDTKNKLLNVMGKSGCCFHTLDSFSFVGGKTILQKSVEIGSFDLPHFYGQQTEKVRQGQQFKTTNVYFFDFDPSADKDAQILSFPLTGKQSKAVYIVVNEGIVDYIITDGRQKPDGFYTPSVEFGAQLAAWQQSKNLDQPRMFTLNARAGRLTFQNQGVTYTVIDTPGKLGVEVVQNGKTTFLPGDASKKVGGLAGLGKLTLKNVK